MISFLRWAVTQAIRLYSSIPSLYSRLAWVVAVGTKERCTWGETPLSALMITLTLFSEQIGHRMGSRNWDLNEFRTHL
jgi:hypothetical protein